MSREALARVASYAPLKRKSGRLAGGWVLDMVALQKAINLCFKCTNRFDPKPHHYARATGFERIHGFVIGECDGCELEASRTTLFLPEQNIGTTWRQL